MRIEKYHAEDMQEAFRLIKAELGPDAVVIQTRKVRLGIFGLFKRPVYEVIAAVDEEAKPAKFAASVPTAAAPARSQAKSAAPARAGAVTRPAATSGVNPGGGAVPAAATAKAPRVEAPVQSPTA